MSLCFIFSGTSEGRELSEALSKEGIKCLVFVATEYGNAVMRENENITVNIGRLDKEEIKNLIIEKTPDYIIDATHPHAEIISKNVKEACFESESLNKYLRVSRSIDKSNNCDDTVIKVKSKEEALKALTSFKEGNILLTTGVKELENFCVEEIKDRLIVRVLPCMESLEEVTRLNIKAKNIIAMEGPFTEGMNKALIEQYDAKVLVTKNSGDRGGYKEKISACKASGIKAIVIEKENEDSESISVKEAVRIITKKNVFVKNIFLTSTSVCDENYLTKKSIDVIKNADVIIGAKRMTDFAMSINKNAEVYNEYMPDAVAEIIKRSSAENIAVLFSGDTGLCSGAKGVYEKLKDLDDIHVEIVPGVSSVSYFSSKICIQYSDYPFISLHGKNFDYMNLLNNSDGFFAICSGAIDVELIVHNVMNVESDNVNRYRIFVGYNLGTDSEEVYEVTEEKADFKDGLYVIAVIKK